MTISNITNSTKLLNTCQNIKIYKSSKPNHNAIPNERLFSADNNEIFDTVPQIQNFKRNNSKSIKLV